MTLPSKTAEITMTKQLYTDFDNSVVESYGVRYPELAEIDPQNAFKLITRAVIEHSRTNSFKAEFLDGSTLKVPEGMRSTTFNDLEARMAESVDLTALDPLDVIVSVFKQPKLMDRLRRRKAEVTTVIVFNTNPAS